MGESKRMDIKSQGYIVRIADLPGWIASGDPVAGWFCDILVDDGMILDRCMCGHKFAADDPPPTFFFYVRQKQHLLWGICGRCSAQDDVTLGQKSYEKYLKPVLPNLKEKGVSLRQQYDGGVRSH